VLRVAQDPQGRHPNGIANIPTISGRLPIPVLSLHTIGDLFVPLSMEQIPRRTKKLGEGAGLRHRRVALVAWTRTCR
jgi:hypothetical protein